MKHPKKISKDNIDYIEDVKICCMFKEGQEFDKSNLEFVRNYGSSCNGHDLHTWDEGGRTLFRCTKCGCLVMEQYSEIHMPDSTYIDYFPIRDEKHAEEVNERYNGWTLETDYPYKMIFFTYKDD